jgi:hypothetical protein
VVVIAWISSVVGLGIPAANPASCPKGSSMTTPIPTREEVQAMSTEEIQERLELLIAELDERTKHIGAEIAPKPQAEI